MKYYLEDGQEIVLEKVLTDEKGKVAYLVRQIYEGTVYRFYNAGGEHGEVSVDYEHEGNQIIVDKIFEKAPTEKIDKTIKSKELELKKITETIGVLSITSKELESKLQSIKTSISSKEFTLIQKEKLLASKQSEIDGKQNELELLLNSIKKQSDLLKKYEDKVAYIAVKSASLDQEAESKTMINNDELSRLQNRDYKLSLLENGGVDNWNGYDTALAEYNEGED